MFKKKPQGPQPFIGARVDKGHVKKAMSEILDKGDVLLGAFYGMPLKDDGTPMGGFANDYLLVTERKVIFWGRGLTSSSTDSFFYDDIASVEGAQGFALGEITLNVRGAKEHVKNMVKKDVPIAVKMIRTQVEKYRQIARQPSVVESIPDQIAKLAELRDKGILSDEEFQTKKADLLKRM